MKRLLYLNQLWISQIIALGLGVLPCSFALDGATATAAANGTTLKTPLQSVPQTAALSCDQICDKVSTELAQQPKIVSGGQGIDAVQDQLREVQLKAQEAERAKKPYLSQYENIRPHCDSIKATKRSNTGQIWLIVIDSLAAATCGYACAAGATDSFEGNKDTGQDGKGLGVDVSTMLSACEGAVCAAGLGHILVEAITDGGDFSAGAGGQGVGRGLLGGAGMLGMGVWQYKASGGKICGMGGGGDGPSSGPQLSSQQQDATRPPTATPAAAPGQATPAKEPTVIDGIRRQIQQQQNDGPPPPQQIPSEAAKLKPDYYPKFRKRQIFETDPGFVWLLVEQIKKTADQAYDFAVPQALGAPKSTAPPNAGGPTVIPQPPPQSDPTAGQTRNEQINNQRIAIGFDQTTLNYQKGLLTELQKSSSIGTEQDKAAKAKKIEETQKKIEGLQSSIDRQEAETLKLTSTRQYQG